MAVCFFSEDTSFCFRGKRRTATWIEQVIAEEYGRTAGDICVIFCSDEYLLQMNRQFLCHDYFTDVITFDYSDISDMSDMSDMSDVSYATDMSVAAVVSGDIFVSVDRVRINAKQYGTGFYEELLRVVIHGVLHLCGQKDALPSEQIRMQTAENRCLARILTKSVAH